jgi:hypothetical protein
VFSILYHSKNNVASNPTQRSLATGTSITQGVLPNIHTQDSENLEAGGAGPYWPLAPSRRIDFINNYIILILIINSSTIY